MKFEWDPDKADANFKKHGVSFEDGTYVFDDPMSLNQFDEAHSIEEERFIIIGHTERGLLFVTYAVRGEETIRVINVRPATSREKSEYYEE